MRSSKCLMAGYDDRCSSVITVKLQSQKTTQELEWSTLYLVNCAKFNRPLNIRVIYALINMKGIIVRKINSSDRAFAHKHTS
jgi:hypothetical protein